MGRLARDLGMSKSGLFAHFRSKRTLEMANEARKIFTGQVLTLANKPVPRLLSTSVLAVLGEGCQGAS